MIRKEMHFISNCRQVVIAKHKAFIIQKGIKARLVLRSDCCVMELQTNNDWIWIPKEQFKELWKEVER